MASMFDTTGGETFRNIFLDNDRFNVQVGLGGVKFLFPDGRTFRQHPLNHIARWTVHHSSLVLYIKSPGDLEERPLSLQGEERTVRSMLDTLTSCCLQMAELMESQKEPESSSGNGNSRRGGASSSSAPTVAKDPDNVSFWSNPDKAGWLQSQGDYMKTWRRRWFVLKGGFLFRFMDPKDVVPSAKPRGVLNLNRATDVGDARKETGKPNSIRAVIENQVNLFIADSETETVEWLSALEGAMHSAVKSIAGVKEAPPAPTPAANPAQDLFKALESSYKAMERAPAPRNPPPPSYMGSTGGNYNAPLPSYMQTGGGYGGGVPEYGRPAPAPQPAANFPPGIVQVTGYEGPSQASPYGQPSPAMHSYGSVHDDFGLMSGGIAGMRPAEPQQPQYAPPQQQPMYMQPQQVPTPQPMAPPAPPAAPSLPSPWQVAYTPEGKPYYYNPQSGVTQWEPPSSFL